MNCDQITNFSTIFDDTPLPLSATSCNETLHNAASNLLDSPLPDQVMSTDNKLIDDTTSTPDDTTSSPLPSPAPAPSVPAKLQVHDYLTKTQLPEDFTPSPYSVLIGRGNACFNSTGNRRLRVIVSVYLDKYSKAQSRIERSIIVTSIVDMIRNASPVGAFIKQENGRWYEVSDHVARERVGAIIRDCLSSQYKSSTKQKQEKRRAQRAELRKRVLAARGA